MKKILNSIVLVLVLSFSLLLASCNEPKQVGSITVTDMVEREVTVNPGTYKKVVCIGAGALRLYSYIGDASLLAGVEDIDNYTASDRPQMFDGVARPYYIANKETYKALPSCGKGGPNAQTVETELIMACGPDLIVSEYEDKALMDKLSSDVGVPVITLKYGSKGVFDEKLAASLKLLGKVLGKDSKATSLVNYINSEKSEIERRVANVSQKPSVYICGLGQWGTTNHLYTAQNYEPFNVANIKNVLTDTALTGIGKIEAEKFVSICDSIDVMIIDSAAIKNIKKYSQEEKSVFNSCKAVNENKVYLQMAYNAYYTNVEIALINTWFNAMVTYPSLFTDIDIKEKTNEVTNAFLGKNLADEIYAYPNSFSGYGQIDLMAILG